MIQMKKLKELRMFLEEEDPQTFLTVKKLAMVSLMEVFKDIIPDYRIRELTEKEKSQPVRKGVEYLFSYT